MSVAKIKMQRVYLFVACRCIAILFNHTDGPTHSRQKRTMISLHNRMLKDVTPLLYTLGIVEAPEQAYRDYFDAAVKVLATIADDGATRVHVLLNLVAYCLDRLPVKQAHTDKLYEQFTQRRESGAWCVSGDDRKASGDRIFTRIENELNIHRVPYQDLDDLVVAEG